MSSPSSVVQAQTGGRASRSRRKIRPQAEGAAQQHGGLPHPSLRYPVRSPGTRHPRPSRSDGGVAGRDADGRRRADEGRRRRPHPVDRVRSRLGPGGRTRRRRRGWHGTRADRGRDLQPPGGMERGVGEDAAMGRPVEEIGEYVHGREARPTASACAVEVRRSRSPPSGSPIPVSGPPRFWWGIDRLFDTPVAAPCPPGIPDRRADAGVAARLGLDGGPSGCRRGDHDVGRTS